MTIEISDDERIVLLHSLMAYNLDTIRYLKDFPDFPIADEFSMEIELCDSLYDKIFNAFFD